MDTMEGNAQLKQSLTCNQSNVDGFKSTVQWDTQRLNKICYIMPFMPLKNYMLTK